MDISGPPMIQLALPVPRECTQHDHSRPTGTCSGQARHTSSSTAMTARRASAMAFPQSRPLGKEQNETQGHMGDAREQQERDSPTADVCRCPQERETAMAPIPQMTL